MDARAGATGARPEEAGGRNASELFIVDLPLPATAREVAQFVALRAAACVGAEYSNLGLLDPGGTVLRLFHGSFLDPILADRYTDLPVDARTPIAAAVHRGTSVLLPDLDAYRDHFPEILADTVAARITATASLPLRRSNGTRLGAIGFAWTDPPLFDGKLESALWAVAGLCTEIIERAERYDDEHQLIVKLQRRLLEDLPEVDGISTVGRYLPAGSPASIGGDWYEGMRLADGRLAVVVGDVTGHGMTAAADMSLIRGMIGALLHSGVPVADVYAEISAVVQQRSGLLLATAALVVIDVGASTLAYATAGHPPPLILQPDGQVQLLDRANGPILGIGRSPRIAGVAPFPPGAQLVMYTDGLVERRDRSFATGVDEAVAHLAGLRAHLDPNQLLDSLLECLITDVVPEDDIVVVVVDNVGRQ